ncbi:MAG: sigma 54-interacting transcriptional regulator [bacterium]
MSGPDDSTNLTATGTDSGAPSDRAPAALVLTVLCHPEADRIGEQAIHPWRVGDTIELSRAAPAFTGAAAARPLDDRGVSRRPLHLQIRPDGLGAASATPLAYTFAGQPLGRHALLPLPTLLAGRPLRCGRRVLLWIEAHVTPPTAGQGSARGPLAGPSAEAHALRARVALLAPHRFPVMVCGPPDTGRAAVARALHDDGPGSAGPFVVAGPFPVAEPAADALDEALARAHGGTLLLPDVEALPPAAQARLGRALATDETAALRVVSTTAIDLEARATAGRFDAPLAYRLRSAHIDVPPLRARPADLARLFVDALRDRLRALGLPDPLATPATTPGSAPRSSRRSSTTAGPATSASSTTSRSTSRSAATTPPRPPCPPTGPPAPPPDTPPPRPHRSKPPSSTTAPGPCPPTCSAPPSPDTPGASARPPKSSASPATPSTP